MYPNLYYVFSYYDNTFVITSQSNNPGMHFLHALDLDEVTPLNIGVNLSDGTPVKYLIVVGNEHLAEFTINAFSLFFDKLKTKTYDANKVDENRAAIGNELVRFLVPHSRLDRDDIDIKVLLITKDGKCGCSNFTAPLFQSIGIDKGSCNVIDKIVRQARVKSLTHEQLIDNIYNAIAYGAIDASSDCIVKEIK